MIASWSLQNERQLYHRLAELKAFDWNHNIDVALKESWPLSHSSWLRKLFGNLHVRLLIATSLWKTGPQREHPSANQIAFDRSHCVGLALRRPWFWQPLTEDLPNYAFTYQMLQRFETCHSWWYGLVSSSGHAHSVIVPPRAFLADSSISSLPEARLLDTDYVALRSG